MYQHNELSQLNKQEELKDYLQQSLVYLSQDKVKMELVSPREIGVIWQISDVPKKIIELFFGLEFEDLAAVMRIYDVTDIVFDGENAHHFYELAIPLEQGSWFVKGLTGSRNYLTEIGVYLNETEFFPFYRSKSIRMSVDEYRVGDFTNDELPKGKLAKHTAPNWQDYVSTYSFYGR